MSVSVHPARGEDRVAWAAMRAALWPDASDDDHQEEIEAYANGGDLICFVARHAERAVGFAEASIRREPVNGCEMSPVGFLEGIYVDPEHRRSGIARALLEAVERWAGTKHCVELGSDSDEANAGGHAFHHGAGFEECERVVFYRKRL